MEVREKKVESKALVKRLVRESNGMKISVKHQNKSTSGKKLKEMGEERVTNRIKGSDGYLQKGIGW